MVLTDWMRRRYGGQKAYLRHVGAWMKWRFGVFEREENIPWLEVKRLVFVCYGNICRSPYAQVVAQDQGWSVASCGLHARAGREPEVSSRQAAVIRGRSLDRHRATPFDSFEWMAGDLALCFEPWHVDEIRRRWAGRSGVHVSLLGLFSRPRRPHIEDPYGLPAEYFDSCFEVIENALIHMKAEADESRQKVLA